MGDKALSVIYTVPSSPRSTRFGSRTARDSGFTFDRCADFRTARKKAFGAT